jgi:CheY-like chemotaxis protein
MRILVAEDQVVSRHILVASLRRWGYDVTAVEDGTHAWEALQAEDAPQLAILDWLMPGMDGIEICRQVRKSPRARPIYVILLTQLPRPLTGFRRFWEGRVLFSAIGTHTGKIVTNTCDHFP